MSQINYDVIVSQLKKELNTNCAISNKYGIVLSSNIKEFANDNVIPQEILDFMSIKHSISEKLNLKEIKSFALEAEKYNYLFTFGEELILISKLDLSVNLSKFMLNLRPFIQKLSNSYKEQDKSVKKFALFDFSKDIDKIGSAQEKENINKDKYSIIKDLVKYISK